jgi:hypothetical protein
MTAEEIGLVERKEGAAFRVRVHPGASREAIGAAHGGSLKVAVAAAPDRGRANEALVALLARRLRVSASRVSVASGLASRSKTIHVEGMPAATVLLRLEGRDDG